VLSRINEAERLEDSHSILGDERRKTEVLTLDEYRSTSRPKSRPYSVRDGEHRLQDDLLKTIFLKSDVLRGSLGFGVLCHEFSLDEIFLLMIHPLPP
jgi:hypothetical protein